MTSKRIKLTHPIVTSRQEAEIRAGEITQKTIELNQLKSEMDDQINSIRESYADRISTLENTISEKTECLRAWAECNPNEFGKARSIDMACALVGFRTGNFQIKTLKGFTWDRVLEKLEALGLKAYVRTKKEVDKQTLIADRDAISDKLPSIGVRVFQEESFFVDPKITEPTTRVNAEVE